MIDRDKQLKYFKITNNEFSNVLYTNSLFTVSLFCLSVSKLDDTLVIISNSINVTSLKKNAKNIIVLNKNSTTSRFKRIVNFHFTSLFKPAIARVLEELVADRAIKYYGSDHIAFSYYFVKMKMTVIEDGEANYQFSDINSTIYGRLKNAIKEKFYFLPYGMSRYVNNIVLTREPSDEVLKDKAILFDFKAVDTEDKDYLRGLFSVDLNPACYKSIVLSQPLSEDGFVSEQQKVAFFKEAVANAKAPVIFKVHPRDATNYSDLFNNNQATILSSEFPVEILAFFIASPFFVFSFFSSATENMKKINSNIISMDINTDNFPDLMLVRKGIQG